MERNKGARSIAGHHVFILNILHRSGNTWSHPEPLPFADMETLKRHLCDVISRNLEYVDAKQRSRLSTYLAAKQYSKVIRLFRMAQLENRAAIPIDFFWKEQPTVVM